MKRQILFPVFLMASNCAIADGFNYNFLQVNYGTVDFALSSIDCDGFGLNGSFGVTENLDIVASYHTADYFEYVTDATEWRVGLGGHSSLSDHVDIVARVEYVNTDIDHLIGQAPPGSVDNFADSGFGLTVGARAKILSRFEVNGGVSYVDLSDQGNEFGFGAGMLFNWTKSISVGAFASWADDEFSYTASARWYFK